MKKKRKYKRRAFFDPRYVRDERRRSYRLALILFWSVLLYFVFERYVISYGIVKDWSMSPTMVNGSHFLVNKYIYKIKGPDRGEVVIFRLDSNGSDWYVKRVVAKENDVLLIRSGKVFINGEALSEPYALGSTQPDIGPLQIPDGYYYVLGDNRISSQDSRHLGMIHTSHIEGRITPGQIFAFI